MLARLTVGAWRGYNEIMERVTCDVAVVGGGLVGLATALALAERRSCRVMVLEAEAGPATHQSGHNSGVIHSGLYYAPGSRKAATCTAGREALYQFCAQHDIPHRRCGKLVVATVAAEVPRLDDLLRRGQANGLTGLQRLDARGVRAFEPAVRGLAGLYVPQTGVVDFRRVGAAMARVLQHAGATLRCSAAVRRVERRGRHWELVTSQGRVACTALVNCAGLQADRVARLCGIQPPAQIIPFRGSYYELCPPSAALVRGLVYPVPDPALPFLGVHFTRTIAGRLHAGPNAVLAFDRHGYRPGSVSIRDLLSMLTYRGFWRMARQHCRTGLREHYQAFSPKAFAAALGRLVPALRPQDLRPAGSGIRAQAVDRHGVLLDDFCVVAESGMVHVLNAPSPAATSSIVIGREIAASVARSGQA